MRLSSIVYILLNSSTLSWAAVSTTAAPSFSFSRVSGSSMGIPVPAGRSSSHANSHHLLRSSGGELDHHISPSEAPNGHPEFEERRVMFPLGLHSERRDPEDEILQRLRAGQSRRSLVPAGGSSSARAVPADPSSLMSLGSTLLASSTPPSIEAMVESDIRVARSLTCGKYNPLIPDDSGIRKLVAEIDRNRYKVKPPELGVAPEGVDDATTSRYTSETIPGIGILSLKRLMGQGEASTVYTIHGSMKYVVKYQSDCPAASVHHTEHPLILDYYFHKKVESLGVTPRVVAISPAEFMPSERGVKCKFGMKQDRYEGCLARGLGNVRYMVMERTGEAIAESMHRYEHRQFPFSAALRLGISLMNILRRLHTEAGVVHGDIHFGNVVFRDNNSDELLLIDFGRAFSLLTPAGGGSSPSGMLLSSSPAAAVSATVGGGGVLSGSPPSGGFLTGLRTPPIQTTSSPPEKVASAFEWTSYQMSPWEIAGYRPGPRDDAFKALMMLTFMINGDYALSYLKQLDRNSSNANATSVERFEAIKQSYRFKMYEDMLVIPDDRYDVLQVKQDMGRITAEQKDALKEKFRNVATHIRQLRINDIPDYELIIGELVAMKEIYRENAPLAATGAAGSMSSSGLWHHPAHAAEEDHHHSNITTTTTTTTP